MYASGVAVLALATLCNGAVVGDWIAAVASPQYHSNISPALPATTGRTASTNALLSCRNLGVPGQRAPLQLYVDKQK